MVRGIRAAIVLIAVLLQSTCWLPFASVFPVSATQTAARLDLSGEITRDMAKSYRIVEITSGASRFYVLHSEQNKTGICTFILNESLAIVQTWRWEDFKKISNTSGGDGVIMDTAGSVVIGNLKFALDSNTGLLTPQYLSTPDNLSAWAFPVPAQNENVSGIWINSEMNVLRYKIFGPPAWDATIPYGEDYAYPLGGSDKLELNRVFVDPEDAGNVVLVMRLTERDEEYHVVQIPKSDFSLSGAMSSPILEYYPYCTVRNVSAELFGWCRDGCIRYSYDRDMYVRFTIPAFGTGHDPADFADTFHYWDADTDVHCLYAAAGDYLYVFDRDSRVLTKLVTWW